MKRYNGFTLIELLVTMVVVVVLLAAGVPSFKQFVKNNRVSGQATKLIIALQVARSEAIKRGSGTVICASTDQSTCSGSNDWASGWITFSDLDRNGVLDGNGSCTTQAEHLSKECIMRVNTALDRVTLTAIDVPGIDDTSAPKAVSNILFSPGGRIRYTKNGATINNPIRSVSFAMKANDCEYQQQRAITVVLQGHTASKKQDCS